MNELYFFMPLVILILVLLWVGIKPKNAEYMDAYNAKETNFGQHFRVYFKYGIGVKLPTGDPVKISKSLLNIIPFLLFSLLTIIVGQLFFKLSIADFYGEGFIVGLLLLLTFLGLAAAAFYYLSVLTARVYVYQNCLVVKNVYKKRVFHYSHLDAIESGINFVKVPVSKMRDGDWPGGFVYLVYDLIKDGRVIFSLGANQYKNLTHLEMAFKENNPYVRTLENTGLQKPEDTMGYYDRVEKSVIAEYVEKSNPETGAYAKRFKVTFKHKGHPTLLLTGDPVIISRSRRNWALLLLLGIIIAGIILLYVKPEILPFVGEPTWRKIPDTYNGDPLSFYGIFLLLFLVLPIILFFILLGRFTSKIYVYRNGMIVKNCYKKRTFYYSQLDSIESYIDLERATAVWGDGSVPLVYNLIKDGEVVFTLSSAHYENLTNLENGFTEDNPYLESLVKTGYDEVRAGKNRYSEHVKNSGMGATGL